MYPESLAHTAVALETRSEIQYNSELIVLLVAVNCPVPPSFFSMNLPIWPFLPCRWRKNFGWGCILMANGGWYLKVKPGCISQKEDGGVIEGSIDSTVLPQSRIDKCVHGVYSVR